MSCGQDNSALGNLRPAIQVMGRGEGLRVYKVIGLDLAGTPKAWGSPPGAPASSEPRTQSLSEAQRRRSILSLPASYQIAKLPK